jgi:hypothetical protein
MLPVTLVVVMAGSAARQYPFGDQRTSTFWAVMVPVLMAVAVAAAIHALCQLGIWRGGRLARGARAAIVVIIGAAAIAGYRNEVRPDLSNIRQIPHEDVRSQVDYVEAHVRPGDVIIADRGASYGFAYYYSEPATAYPDLPTTANGFIPGYPGNPHVIVMAAEDPAGVAAAVRQARGTIAAQARATGSPGTRGRIWILLLHDGKPEASGWDAVFGANVRAGGTVTWYYLRELGYLPGWESVILLTLPMDTREA